MSDDPFNFDLDDLYAEARQAVDASTPDSFGLAYQSLAQQQQKYHFKGVLGEGGMKVVHKVYDNFLRRDVAYATLKPGLRQTLYDAFIYEAWLTAQLEHPNIIKVYDLGIGPDQIPFFTMDLKTGESLNQWLKSSDLSINERLETFIKVCDAISYAHSKGILHLDIKPDNIQIGTYGEVVVCDWGLGKFISTKDRRVEEHPEAALLEAELFLQNDSEHTGGRGTPGFMAPEQVAFGQQKSKQTDVYGLGALLYYILTGRKPIGGSVERMLKRTLVGQLAPLPHQMPESLVAVIGKAMAIVPTKRYPTVKSLRTDVHNYLMGYSTSAENAGFIREGLLLIRRNQSICLILSVFLIVLLCGSLWFVYSLDRSRRAAVVARNEALAAKNEAVAAQQAARENLVMANQSMAQLKQTLTLYEAEKNASQQLMINFEKAFYEPKNYWEKRKFFDKPYEEVKNTLEKLEVILARNPADKRALFEKSKLKFISGNYSSGAELIRQHHIDGLAVIPAVVEALQLHWEKRDQIWEFIKIVDFFVARNQATPATDEEKLVLSKLVTYDFATRQYKQHYAEIVKRLLIYLNPDWNPELFKYDWEREKLYLRGPGLKHIAMMILSGADDSSILRFIPIKELDLSYTNFEDPRELSTLNLKGLNISHTQVKSLEVIRKFPDLKYLTIHRGQFPADELNKFFKHVKIYIVD